MRLAGSTDVFNLLAEEFGEENPAVNSDLDAFMRLNTMLQSQGYGAQAAEVTAMEMMKGNQPMASTSKRFAGIYDD